MDFLSRLIDFLSLQPRKKKKKPKWCNELYVWIGDNGDESGYAVNAKVTKGKARKTGIKQKGGRFDRFVLTKFIPTTKKATVKITHWTHGWDGDGDFRNIRVSVFKKKKGKIKQLHFQYDNFDGRKWKTKYSKK